MFEKAGWIWREGLPEKDCYADFEAVFCLKAPTAKMRISAASDYAVNINGKAAFFGQFPDYKRYKIYDEVDISEFVKAGENRAVVTVRYDGSNCFTAAAEKAGVIFEIASEDEVVFASSEATPSRQNALYKSGEMRLITGQLGYGYRVDFTKEEEAFSGSAAAEKPPEKYYPRPVKKLVLAERKPFATVSAGSFCAGGDETPASAFMTAAALIPAASENAPFTLKKSDGDGVYFIIDGGKEDVGFLDFEIEVPKECEMHVGWGEFIDGDRLRTRIGGRDFSLSFKLKAGKNVFSDRFRRLGGRYLQFFVKAPEVRVIYAGIRPVYYPNVLKEKVFNKPERKEIYDIGVNTLRCCMHDHYEDCPWREQGLYTLDSRNQMLSGYAAFEGTEFQKASLMLIASSIRENGLLPICAPTSDELYIPCYSLFFIVQVYEYYKRTGDLEPFTAFGAADAVMRTFIDRIDGSGLFENMTGEGVWNYYEWAHGLSGKATAKYDAAINAVLSRALGHYAELCDADGRDGSEYVAIKSKLNKAIRKRFFDRGKKLFHFTDEEDKDVFSVTVNVWCVLCGAAEDTGEIVKIITADGGKGDFLQVVTSSLAYDIFRYEALLLLDAPKYRGYILQDIDRIYGVMKDAGATSFWETYGGHEDFNGAGSLCHGWSAACVYFYDLLGG